MCSIHENINVIPLEALLHYQQHTFADMVEEERMVIQKEKNIMKLCKPLLRRWLLKQSPNFGKTHQPRMFKSLGKEVAAV